ncbi:MAG: LAGLIDADG family homing endonuclease [Candidatus Micrarchaeota archaeon]|nr:LAGLIDADG family homing endonuclease [Candidatus Micrarchaeota archaeon]
MCIARILENFSIVFGVKKNQFRYYITAPTNSNDIEVKDFWKNRIGNFSFRLNKYHKTKKKFGWMTIAIHDKYLKNKLELEIESIINTDTNNLEVLRGFLRGFFAAEGAVIPGKIRKVIPNSIQFPQKGDELPKRISVMLNHFGIESRVVLKQKKADYYCANVTGFENFEKLFRFDITNLHPEKKEKVEIGLNSYTHFTSRKLKFPTKLLKILKEKPRNRLEIYSLLNSYPQKINGMLYSKSSYLVKNKLIAKEISENGEILWGISSEGREFLKHQQ